MFDMETEINKLRKKYRRRGIPDSELSACFYAAKIMADMGQIDDRAALLYIRSVLSEKYGVKDFFAADDVRHNLRRSVLGKRFSRSKISPSQQAISL